MNLLRREPLPTGGACLLFAGDDADAEQCLALTLPSALAPGTALPPRLDDVEALWAFREHRGRKGTAGLIDESVLWWCMKAAQRFAADVRLVRWRDGAACLTIRSKTCPPLPSATFLACYRAARLHLERSTEPECKLELPAYWEALRDAVRPRLGPAAPPTTSRAGGRLRGAWRRVCAALQPITRGLRLMHRDR